MYVNSKLLFNQDEAMAVNAYLRMVNGKMKIELAWTFFFREELCETMRWFL